MMMVERIVCLGDSITEGIGDPENIGWVGRLNKIYSMRTPQKWILTNLGIAGDTSSDIKHRLISEAIYRSPQRIIISAGLNDIIFRLLSNDAGSRMNINHSRQIWKDIFVIIKHLNVPCIILGLSPVNEKKLPLVYKPVDQNDQGFDVKNKQVLEYESILHSETNLAGIKFIPLFEKLIEAGYIDTLDDGIHPNNQGYNMITNIIMNETEGSDFFDN